MGIGQSKSSPPCCVTERKDETFEFDWIVKRFSTFMGCPEVVSDTFKGPNGQYSWQVHLKPRQMVDGVEWVQLFLNRTGVIPLTTKELNARLEFSLRDSKGELGNQLGGPTMTLVDFRNNNSSWGWNKFIRSADLTATGCRWLEDDTLRIHCSLWINGELKHETSQQQNAYLSVNNNLKTLGGDLGNLLRDGQFTDVTLVTNTKTFKAHKNILAVRSKVFAAMFASPMTEAVSGSISIPDFDEDTVEGMLQHMYKDQVDKLVSKSRSLLQIAEKYDLPGLKEECEISIANALTVETAANDLVLAHMLNATLLKPRVIQFIMGNKEAVKKTQGFQNVLKNHSSLLLELLF